MFDGPRHLTRGVQTSVELEIQLVLWSLIDQLQGIEEVCPDYLQVFELKPVSAPGTQLIQEVYHHQETPPFEQRIAFHVLEPVTAKIFVIDDTTHSTMLLAEEY